ncbi:MAG: DNA primase [Dehalococcoidia bacterium]|nr:DNA primase [Dehalococcoidia bacterium]
MDPVAEIKARLDITEYVGRHVDLQRAGRNLRGLCPFHQERTPSFYVFPDRGTWRCFGQCGEGGDIFTFAQKRGGLDFRSALTELADLAGVELSRQSSEQRGRRDHLAALLSAAVEYYQRQLAADNPDAARARAYLHEERGITSHTASQFRLGYAPSGWRSLGDYLHSRGYTDADAVAAGLLIEPERGGRPYDRFRDRLIVPIADERGVFVGLGGRSLDGSEPKYLNSPQTELFDKGRILFGLDLAAEAARERQEIVVVEGYMDVIGPHQAGFKNVVATMGTSLTTNHAAILRRSARRIVLALDPDAAGAMAAERAGGVFLPGANDGNAYADAAREAERIANANEVEVFVASLPAGVDPDELARDAPDAWSDAIGNAVPYTQFLLGRMLAETSGDSPLELRRLVQRIAPVLRAVSNPIERGRYVARVATQLDVDESEVWLAVRPKGRNRNQQTPGADTVSTRLDPEERLLAIILQHPSLRPAVQNLPADLFTNGINREVFQRWLSEEHVVESTDGEDLVADQAARLRSARLPEMDGEQAREAAGQKITAILPRAIAPAAGCPERGPGTSGARAARRQSRGRARAHGVERRAARRQHRTGGADRDRRPRARPQPPPPGDAGARVARATPGRSLRKPVRERRRTRAPAPGILRRSRPASSGSPEPFITRTAASSSTAIPPGTSRSSSRRSRNCRNTGCSRSGGLASPPGATDATWRSRSYTGATPSRKHAVPVVGVGPVVLGQQAETQLVSRYPGQQIARQHQVAQRLAHLGPFELEHPIVHPPAREGLDIVRALGLGDLVLVVGKAEVVAAAMDIDLRAQERARHGSALNAPAGPARPPGAVPRRIPRFDRLP